MPAPKRPRRPIQARPGEPLAFFRSLRAAGTWPPTEIRRDHKDVPPAMPYIVVPIDPTDTGSRPAPGDEALHSTAIEVLDAAGNAVDRPVPGTAYALRVTIRNLGPAAAYGGVVEFAIADADATDAATFAIEGFVAPPGDTVAVTCRRSWTPADSTEALSSIVVHAYDALLDRPTQRFDPHADRHVARRDLLPDFAGTWDGLQRLVSGPPGQGALYRVVIEQHGSAAAVSIFEQVTEVTGGPGVPVGGGSPRPGRGDTSGTLGTLGGSLTPVLPGVPQLTGSSTVTGDRMELSIIGLNGQPPVPFTKDDITLTLTAPDALHVTQHEVFMDPADTRGPYDFVADLHRKV